MSGKDKTMFLAFNGLLYTIGWWISIYLGALNRSWAAIPSIIFIVSQLFFLYKVNIKAYYQDLFLSFYSLLIGLFIEFIFTRFHLIAYQEPDSIPLWILMLYPLFALTINHSMRWMQTQAYLPGILGFFAPLVYLAGSHWGACHFPQGVWLMCVGVIPCWSIFLYGLCQLNLKLKQIIEQIFKPLLDTKPVVMLYDGDCPICSKEVNWMQRDCSVHVKLVDITDPHYSPAEYQNIDYPTAMQAIHAIDSNGEVVLGTEAFAKIYTALRWRFLAILLSVPFFKPLFNMLYKGFAKYRLLITGRKLDIHK